MQGKPPLTLPCPIALDDSGLQELPRMVGGTQSNVWKPSALTESLLTAVPEGPSCEVSPKKSAILAVTPLDALIRKMALNSGWSVA